MHRAMQEQAQLIKGLQEQVVQLVTPPPAAASAGDQAAGPRVLATPAAYGGHSTSLPPKTPMSYDYGSNCEDDNFNKTAKTLSGSAALKQQIQSAEALAKMEVTLPKHDVHCWKTLHTWWSKEVWMELHK
mmetsp:Transcript_37683/g.94454  ORF Transcript_37683/g.94454 Transcript_37683/m.94454 type:complete len:130 (-) Transcript_37683:744-1133(-)